MTEVIALIPAVNEFALSNQHYAACANTQTGSNTPTCVLTSMVRYLPCKIVFPSGSTAVASLVQAYLAAGKLLPSHWSMRFSPLLTSISDGWTTNSPITIQWREDER